MKYSSLSLLLFVFSLSFGIIACEDDLNPNNEEPPIIMDCGSVPCTDDLLPIVFVHGFLGSGDTYNNHIQRFMTNGYPLDHLYLFDYNSIGGVDNDLTLQAFISEILSRTNKDQLNLVGHSAGGGLSYTVLEDPITNSQVAHYAHIGSSPNNQPAGIDGNTPTINIYSPDDQVVAGAAIPMAANVSLIGQDHYQVATSLECFKALYTFFNEGFEVQKEEVDKVENPQIAGVVRTFAENTIVSEVSIDIYAIDQDGERVSTEANFNFMTDEKGNWGPFTGDSNYVYEFHLTKPGDSDFRPIHYYHDPIESDKYHVYLRSFPPANSFAGLFLSSVPNDDSEAAVVIFSSSKAVISGRDLLSIDDQILSTPALASADQTAIAFFAYDDGDLASSGNPLASFSMFPFLNGIDLYFPTEEDQIITLKLNEETIKVKNWKSKSEGVTVAIFE